MCVKSAGNALRHALACNKPARSRKTAYILCRHNILRDFHSSVAHTATPLPIGLTQGPPPSAPAPAATQHGARVDRIRRQAEMRRQGKELRASQNQSHHGKQNVLKKRFWKHVHVNESPDGYQIFLDARPLRTPNKTILTLPLSKPHLANAIALEWDVLTSAQQALKTHNIPLTSLTSRADDIKQQESQSAPGSSSSETRDDILNTVMRYLETDTLLCWAPAAQSSDPHDVESETHANHHHPPSTTIAKNESLRDIQRRTAQPILSYLTTRVWPGAEFHPVLDESSILPREQLEMTKNIIRGWVSGLPAYELAALERAVLASKSLLVATRLLVEWSEEFRHLQNGGAGSFATATSAGDRDGDENNANQSEDEHQADKAAQRQRFGIQDAAEACSTEVTWQTRMWGEVEDTHDVEKEDLTRQLGSVVVLVCGDT